MKPKSPRATSGSGLGVTVIVTVGAGVSAAGGAGVAQLESAKAAATITAAAVRVDMITLHRVKCASVREVKSSLVAVRAKDAVARMCERYARDMTSAERVLIVVDAQKAFADPAWGPRDNPEAEANIVRLLQAWRSRGWPVVLVRHDSVEPGSPLAPGAPGNDFHDGVDGPHDLLVTKSVNSAFYGEPNLHDWLQARGATRLTLCGITTDHCCSTTARMAGNLGYDVDFVLDATHCHDRSLPDGSVIEAEQVARAAAASLHGEFATVITTEQAVRSLGRPRS